MGTKKGKALALELMDDLLKPDDRATIRQPVAAKPETKKIPVTAPVAKQEPPDHFEFSKSLIYLHPTGKVDATPKAEVDVTPKVVATVAAPTTKVVAPATNKITPPVTNKVVTPAAPATNKVIPPQAAAPNNVVYKSGLTAPVKTTAPKMYEPEPEIEMPFETVDDDTEAEKPSAKEPSQTQIANKTEPIRSSQVPQTQAIDEDRTLRLNPMMTEPLRPPTPPYQPSPPPRERERPAVGRFGNFRAGGGPASSSEAALVQSESLRIAQNRLIEFETEIERLRLQNEELAAAGETLRRRTDELTASNQKRESDYQFAVSTFRSEKEILNGSKEALQRDLENARQKHDELELRISTNIQKIRVRERELENRLELVKMESAALIRSKDEMILDLKRQMDQLNLELNNYRGKNQELNRQTTDKQEMLRRTVKALRLALSMLEGEEEAPKAAPLRKIK